MTQPANRRLVTEDRFIVEQSNIDALQTGLANTNATIASIASLSPNAIINGAFEINQRGFTSTIAQGYGFDRWATYFSDGTITHSAQAFTPGVAPVAGYEAKNFVRTVVSGQTLAGAYAHLIQSIEDVRTFAGQTVTVSFWAKAASGTPKVAVEFVQSFGTGGSPSANVNSYAGQVTLSTSWARYSVTYSIPSISGKTIGTTANTSSLQLVLWESSGSTYSGRNGSIGIQNNTFDFWGVQLETGSVATAFRRNASSIAGELAACQRYYQRLKASWVYQTFIQSMQNSTTSAQGVLALTNSLRTTPSAIEFGGNIQIGRVGVAGFAVSNITLLGGKENAVDVTITSANTGYSNGTYVLVTANNDINAYIAVSAEL